MNFDRWSLTFAVTMLTAAIAIPLLCTRAARGEDRPNIILIMADDLGYSDLGCYGGEIQTPNLDSLAAGGLRFTQFYNTGRCWPTRASLLTGYYPHSVRRDRVPGVKSGGAGQRPDWAPLICEPLRNAGYRTYHTGKWHLDGMPIDSGFDLSYYLKDQNRFFNPTAHFQNDQKLDPIEKESGYYATVALGNHAVECLKQHSEQHNKQPFFHYLAFTAPHFPLHALQQDIAKYRDVYLPGWEEIRSDRWERIQKLGLVTSTLSAVQPNVGPPYDRPEDIKQLGDGEVNRPVEWKSLNPKQREFQATKMAIHAAMIDCMDQQIGRVLDQLRTTEQLDNTIVMFLSDNGASAEIMVRGDGHDQAAAMGSWATHLCLGPGWSTLSNTPFRYHKTWTHEGGTATPLIVHWPEGIRARGELRRQPGHVIDIWPTLLELSGLNSNDQSAPDRPGQSLVAAFTEETDQPRTLWWSHEGNRALRVGDWKISSVKNGPWELYDLSTDRNETYDLATKAKEKLAELTKRWIQLNNDHAAMASNE
jgi:arylsulfatase A-like enzyme